MFKALKIRIYPNEEQQKFINKTAGCSRKVWNLMLADNNARFDKFSDVLSALKIAEETANLKIKEIKQLGLKKKERVEQETKWKERIETVKRLRKQIYSNMFKIELKTLGQMKKDPELQYLKEADCYALCNSYLDLNQAFANFFDSISGKRKGAVMGKPNFKKKSNGAKYTTSQCNGNMKLNFENKQIKLPKMDWIKFRDPRILDLSKLTIKSATVSKTVTDKYYVSVLYETEQVHKQQTLDDLLKTKEDIKVCGLDMAMNSLYVDDQGSIPNGFRNWFRDGEKQLAKLTNRWSRKKMVTVEINGKETKVPSNRRYRARLKVNRKYEKQANQRKEFNRAAAVKLLKQYDVICIEDLNMHGQAQLLHLGKSVHEIGWGQFTHWLEYKAPEYGTVIMRVSKWFPSTQMCSDCGERNEQKIVLGQGEWVCEHCGSIHHRDQNAAINLKQFAEQEINKLRLERSWKDTEGNVVTHPMKCQEAIESSA